MIAITIFMLIASPYRPRSGCDRSSTVQETSVVPVHAGVSETRVFLRIRTPGQGPSVGARAKKLTKKAIAYKLIMLMRVAIGRAEMGH
jgi:hypothetical protein